MMYSSKPAVFRVTAIIPALNEAQSIADVVRSTLEHVDQIIVADNGSSDATASEAKAAGAVVVEAVRRGYGSACLAGLEALAQSPSPPDAVLFLDGDGSDDPSMIPALLAPICTGDADFVLGSRTRGVAERGALTPPQRLGAWMMGQYLKRRFGVEASDLGPFRAIRYDALRKLEMDDQDFGWTIQMQARAASPAGRLRCVEIPVPYRTRQAGKSKISGTIRGSVLAAKTILHTAWRERNWQPSRAGHVAVVAKMPEPGRVKTRLAASIGDEQATQLHDRMLRHMLKRTSAHARTLWWAAGSAWTPQRVQATYGPWLRCLPQPEGDLGTRIAMSFQEAFDQGHAAAVVIGTDTPDVSAQDLDEALNTLLSGEADAVLGPAKDGGFWLLGFKQKAWRSSDLLEGIDWGTEQVLGQTQNALTAAGLKTSTLRTLQDIDTVEDLPVWQRYDAQSDPDSVEFANPQTDSFLKSNTVPTC